jgi:two-component system, NarL family, nitrate/nitrite response regulator NarL
MKWWMALMEPIKLAIVDSEEVFREGIAKLLKDQAKMEIVFQGSSSQEAIEKCNRTKPDMVLIDSHIAGVDALQAVKDIKANSPEIKVVMLSRSDSGKNALDFMKAGARAFLAKNISGGDLIKSIELISSGRIIISPLFAEKFLEDISSSTDEKYSGESVLPSVLSEREMEIALLIAKGDTNKEIAEKLFITENTAKVHVKNILHKLELKNRQQLAVYAVVKEWVMGNPDSEKKVADNPK